MRSRAILLAAGALLFPHLASAGGGTLSTDGDLELSIHVRSLPSQDDLDVLREQVERAQLLLCDATDGLIKLRRVTLTRRPSDERRADGWWYPINGRENSSLAGLGDPAARFLLFGNANAASAATIQAIVRSAEVRPVRLSALSFSTAATIAHELGHYVLGIGDEYPETNRWDTGCGFGPGFDNTGLFDDGVTPARKDGAWNTLLQSPAQVCVNGSGQTHNDLNPFLGPIPCADDTTCAAFNVVDTWTCQADAFGSELAVASNFDGRRAPWTQGIAPAGCPAARPGTRMVLHAKVIRDVGGNQGVLSLADFNPGNFLTYNVGLTLGAMDNVGEIKGAAPSLHDVHSVLLKHDVDKVMLIILADDAEYANPPPGLGTYTPWRRTSRSVFELARFALEFREDGTLERINGTAVDAEGRDPGTGTLPRIILGGGIAPAFGSPTDGAAGQSVNTGSFQPVNGATPAPIGLELALGGIEINNYESQTVGVAGNSAFFCSDPVQCPGLRRHIDASRIEAAGGLPQVGRCTDTDWCAAVYHPGTGAFEGTGHTYRSLLAQANAAGQSIAAFIASTLASGSIPEVRSDWDTLFDLYGNQDNNLTGIRLTDFIAPRQAVEPTSPTVAQCGGLVQIDEDDIEVPDRFFIVLDRSGSMMYTSGITQATRLDFVKAAAQAVVSSFAGSGAQIGVVTFADEATVDQTLTTNYAAVRGAIDAAAPNGYTAIGSGLLAAAEQLRATGNPAGNGILLLTDGANNRPCECLPEEARLGLRCPVDAPGTCTAEPVNVARDLENEFILYTVPVGSAADRGELSQMAALTGGEMLDTTSDDQIIPSFIQAYAAFRGQSLLLERTESFVEKPPVVVRQDSGPSLNLFDLPVEVGAQRLDVVLSVRDSDPGQWDPSFVVIRPDGTSYVDSTNPGSLITSHPYFRMVRIDSPAPGNWQLLVRAPATDLVGTTRSYVIAHVENPLPDCFVGATPARPDGTGPVRISATSSHSLPLESGVSFSGKVLRPDGSEVALTFEREGPGSDRRIARFNPGQFVGRGIYDVQVQCSVLANARAVRGEGDDSFKPENEVDVHPFTRTASASFFLDVSDLPPLPPGNDCDGDGILNADEPPGDTDGDGLPDICDDDADNDDVWDGIDPDPTDPTIRDEECQAIPSAVGCCVRLATCAGARSFALYADETLDIQDRVRVRTQSGSPAAVVNAGTASTTVGADAAVGELFSKSGVFLRERARVDGAVITEGAVTQQNGVVVTDGITEQAALSTPSLSTFAVAFPGSHSGDFPLEPGQRDTLVPGSYAHVSVKSTATLDLRSGTYYLKSLTTEPDSVINLDTSGGAVFLYVQESLLLKGTMNISSPSGLFVGFFGSGTAFLENDFSGTVVAPNGGLVLSAGGSDRYQGGFFAKNLLVRPDVQVRGVPFTLPWTAGAGRVLSSKVEAPTVVRTVKRGCTWGSEPRGSALVVPFVLLGLAWSLRRRDRPGRAQLSG